jgi:putative membrane protein
MEEKMSTEATAPQKGIKSFLLDILAGFGIGVAFIIPGFSGGSVAAILGIYERLVGAIADIFKDFKRSVATLLPIFIGLVLGAVSLLYPLGWALEAFPIPTAALFVGLALGGLPSITDNIKGRVAPTNIIAFAVPLVIALSLSFIPSLGDRDLLASGPLEYILLFFVGVLGSSALVIPGISGSMILLILGYYNPIVSLIINNFIGGEERLRAFFILMTVGIGIIVGFIGISMIMKQLLRRCKRGTYFAIIGFILGSVPTVFVSTASDAGYLTDGVPSDPIYWVVSVLLLLLGAAVSLFVVFRAKKLSKKD